MRVMGRWSVKTVDVRADGTGLSSRAGTSLLALVADRIGLTDGLRRGVKGRKVQMSGAAFSGDDAAHYGGAIGDGLLRVERAFLASESLDEQAGLFIYEYAHKKLASLAGPAMQPA